MKRKGIAASYVCLLLAGCTAFERSQHAMTPERNEYSVAIPAGFVSPERFDRPPAVRVTAEPIWSERGRHSLNRFRFPDRIEISVVLFVDELGVVRDAKVERSDFSIFEDDVISTARRWRFEPAEMNGRPASFWFRQVFVFRFPGEQNEKGESKHGASNKSREATATAVMAAAGQPPRQP